MCLDQEEKGKERRGKLKEANHVTQIRTQNQVKMDDYNKAIAAPQPHYNLVTQLHGVRYKMGWRLASKCARAQQEYVAHSQLHQPT